MVEEYYVPLPEEQWRESLNTITPETGMIMESITSIIVWGSGAIIHYDHWEDGYELEINTPAQPSTEIWGDGNNANGKPPSYTNDPFGLPKGTVVVLRNLVSLPRDRTILYDGHDRFGSNRSLVVSRAGWTTAPVGSRLASMVNVAPARAYGNRFVCPIGEDVITAASLFSYTGLLIMARDSGTEVQIDIDGPGPGTTEEVELNRGESYLVNGGILKGASVETSRPVQAHLITGGIYCYCYMSRSYTMYPEDQWTGSYMCPVGTMPIGNDCYVFIYNPNDIPITINAESAEGKASLDVDALSVYQWEMPGESGARFQSLGGERFLAVTAVNADLYAQHIWEWGFSLVPEHNLSSETIVGWGPGSTDLSENGSPVYVCPSAATRIYADYNGDGAGSRLDPRGGRYDVFFDLAAYESQAILEPDNDQTAMRLYTLDNVLFSAAWGIHREYAGANEPFMGLGVVILPGAVATLQKDATLKRDRGMPGLSVGDIMEYRVTILNNGVRNLDNLRVEDSFHPSLTYQTNSTQINGVAIADDGTGTTLFPLDEAGYIIASLPRNETAVLTYEAVIDASGTVTNTATLPDYGLSSENVLEVPETEGEFPIEGETEGETPVYGVTLDACAASPNPVITGQSINLTGLNGQCRGIAEGQLVKVTVGLRDLSGTWAGGDPVVVYSGTPGTAWYSWSGSAVLTAPAVAGTYAIWVRHTPDAGPATAIQDFKSAAPTLADEIRDDNWETQIAVISPPVEGEGEEGEPLVYGVTVDSCTITPNPVNPGMPITLTGLAGQYHAGMDNQTMKVTVGFRDGSGAWKGGEPVVVWTGKPGVSWQAWSGGATLLAPSQPGSYYVWVRNTPTINDSAAVTDFKNTVVPTPDEAQNDRFETPLTVSSLQGIQLVSCVFSPNPATPGQKVSLSSLGGQYRGPSVSATVKITAGLRDASGAWVGSDPVVVKTGIPGMGWKAWTGSAMLIAPLTEGTCHIWVRSTATTSDRDAVADFKAAVPSAGDEQYNDTWTTSLVVRSLPTEGEGEPEEGEVAEGEDTPPEGESEGETPECCGCVCTDGKNGGLPLHPLNWLGDLLVLGVALTVLSLYRN